MDLVFSHLRERDIDILLVEELCVNEEFGAWFCGEALALSAGAQILTVNQSINTKYDGETDIQIVLQTSDGMFGLLIENKVSAPPGRNQAQRYKNRGQSGVDSGRWKQFRTCLFAPQGYLAAPNHCNNYHLCISYETVRDYFLGQSSRRSAFKARMLEEAIQQNRRGNASEPHEQVTQFFADYHKLVEAEHPHLEAEKPHVRAAGSHWMVFRPIPITKGVSIRHKLPQGEVRLYIPVSDEDEREITSALVPVLNSRMTLGRTAASVTVHIRTPKIVPRVNGLCFSDVDADVRKSLAAVKELADLYRQFRAI